MKKVLVTGGCGQLASCIRQIADEEKEYRFVYVDFDELDITEERKVKRFFEKADFHFCVNCAAYTAVDKAESEPKKAQRINCDGPRNLARACKEHRTTLIHISTDFVFDGSQSVPYSESSETSALGVYGTTKLAGEKAIAEVLEENFIIRTSWLYSSYGNNFMKTMLRLGKERDTLNVVCDQIGTPTHGIDLAKAILHILIQNTDKYGLYHFSNEGVASWYDFSRAIFDLSGSTCQVLPVGSNAYPTLAKRPAFSVLDKTKIKSVLGVKIPYWRDSLKECLQNNSQGSCAE